MRSACPALVCVLALIFASSVSRDGHAGEKEKRMSTAELLAIINALSNGEMKVWDETPALALAEFGPASKETVPALMAYALKGPHPWPERYYRHTWIFQALGNIGPEAADAIPLLIAGATQSGGVVVRTTAVRTIRNMGAAAVPVLIKALKSPEAFDLEGSRRAFTPSSSMWLKRDETDIKIRAAFLLGYIGADAREAAPALVHALTEDKDNFVRAMAAFSLGMIAPDSAEVRKALIQVLRREEQNEYVHWGAAVSLGKMSRFGREAVAVLVLLTRDLQYIIEAQKIPGILGRPRKEGLGRLDIPARQAVRAAKALINDDKAGDILEGTSGMMARVEDAALSEIREAAWRYYDWHVRTWAVLLLGHYPKSRKSTREEQAIIVDEAVSMLLRTLRTENSAFNFLDLSVAQALGEIGPEAKAATPALIERLREDRGKALVIFGDALRKIDPSVDVRKAMTKE